MQPPSLRCPQCGAPVQPVEDDPFLACPFCGTRAYLDAGGAVRHLIVEPRLDRAAAGAALARWLKGQEVVGAAAPAASELVFFPVWLVRIGGRKAAVPAAGALYEGLDRIEVPAGDAKVFAQERVRGPRGEPARALEATVPLQAAISRAAARARGLTESRIASGAAAADPPSDAEAALLHLPLQLITYVHNGVTYRAAVDACSGRVYPITAPRSSERRIDAAFAALLAAGLALNLLALSYFSIAPVFSIALLGFVGWALFAGGMRLARWTES